MGKRRLRGAAASSGATGVTLAAASLGLSAIGAHADAPVMRIGGEALRAPQVSFVSDTPTTLSTAEAETVEVASANGASILLAERTQARVEYVDNVAAAPSPRTHLVHGALRVFAPLASSGVATSFDGGIVELAAGAAIITREGDALRATLLYGGPLLMRHGERTVSVERPNTEIFWGPNADVGVVRTRDRSTVYADLDRFGVPRAGRTSPQPGASGARDYAAVDDNRVLGQAPAPPPLDRTALTQLSGGEIVLGASARSFVDIANQNLSGNAQFTALLGASTAQPITLAGGVLARDFGATAPPGLAQPRTTNRIVASGSTYHYSGGIGPSYGRTDGNASLSYVISAPIALSQSPIATFSGLVPPYDDADVREALTRIGLIQNADGDPQTPPVLCESAGCAELAALIRSVLQDSDDLRLVLGSVSGRATFIPGAPQTSNLTATNQILSLPRETLRGARSGVLQASVPATGFFVAPGLSPSTASGGIGNTGISSDIRSNAVAVDVLQAGFDIDDADGNGVLRAADHFLMIQAPPPNGDVGAFLFATGGLSAAQTGGDTIDAYSLYSSLTGPGGLSTGGLSGAGMRAFAPGDAAAYGAGGYAASPLLVATSLNGPANAQNAFLHFDLGWSATGALTAAALTLGSIRYAESAPGAGSAIVLGRTIGTSRAPGAASTTLRSPLTNTAFGGGGDWGGDGARSGAASYLVLENVASTLPPPDDDLTGASAFSGGVTRALGSRETAQYGLLRVAIGSDYRTDATPQRTLYGGYLQGLLEIEDATGAVTVSAFDSGGDNNDPRGLSIEVDTGLNRVAAQALLRVGDADERDAIALGGLTTDSGPSAAIQDARGAAAIFGAASRGDAEHALALVSGASATTDATEDIAHYDYVHWGYFFGDLPAEGGQSRHAHLATWAAGQILAPSQYQLRGSARYTGHAIGSAIDQNGVRMVVGTFSQTWNLDARTGAMDLMFDGSDYRAASLRFDDLATDLRYGGYLGAANGDRYGVVNGVLVGLTPNALPGGSVGQFAIQNLPSSAPYSAVGTFGGDIAPSP
ncbi:MAG: hypothetical protein NW203_09350 [Hyphomonadaceae bacterium]|nr:hypothetical protein [Hyphomonadaceae bacterium]